MTCVMYTYVPLIGRDWNHIIIELNQWQKLGKEVFTDSNMALNNKEVVEI